MGFALICPDGGSDEKLIAFVEMEAAIRPLLAAQSPPQSSQAKQTETERHNQAGERLLLQHLDQEEG
jgi:hypothetical protein